MPDISRDANKYVSARYIYLLPYMETLNTALYPFWKRSSDLHSYMPSKESRTGDTVKLPSDIIVVLLSWSIIPFFRHVTGMDFVHGHDKTMRLSLPATATTLFTSISAYSLLSFASSPRKEVGNEFVMHWLSIEKTVLQSNEWPSVSSNYSITAISPWGCLR